MVIYNYNIQWRFKMSDLQQLIKQKEIREGRELSLQLEKIKKEILKLKAEELLSKNFNYEELLKKYDTESIDKSVIKYYKAIQSWTNDLMNKLDLYEKEKEDTIQNFNLISLKLSKEYENDKRRFFI